MKKYSFILIFLFVSSTAWSQLSTFRYSDSGKEIGRTYISPDIENFVEMLNASNSVWETWMKKYYADKRDLVENGVMYSFINAIGTDHGILFITKKPEIVTYFWYLGNDNATLLDELVDSLQKNYIGTTNGKLTYLFKFNNIDYVLLIRRDNKTEAVTIYKKR